MTIPTEIKVDFEGTVIPILQIEGLPTLGYWRDEVPDIGIRADQPEPGKVVILIHEMMHAAENQLLGREILGDDYLNLRQTVGEQFVTNMSALMFQWMACSGMLSGVTPEDAEAFILSEIERGDA